MFLTSRYLHAIDTKRSAILRSVEALEPEDRTRRPNASTWSAVEIVEHLVLAEQTVLGDVRTASSRADRELRTHDRLRSTLVWFVLRFGIRVSVPAESMRPSGAASFEALRAQWIEQHRQLRTFVESLDARGLRRRVFHHPIAGPLSVREALQMLDAHLLTHQRQLARLQHTLRQMPGNTPPIRTDD